ncbi:MAG TPA: hypothetical protein VFC78_21280 [Tepidisphaeraceae bacterium]|nr:hypothetical protein [Tepidisphaeraceae bacterium]
MTDAQQPILDHLKSRELKLKSKIIFLLLVGLPAMFFGPFIMALIYGAVGLSWGFLIPWSWALAASVVIFLPLLFLSEWRTKGSYYTDAIASSFDYEPMASVGFSDIDALIRFVQNPRGEVIGLVEIFLWGPRQVLEAAVNVSRVRLFKGVSRTRAAEILAKLNASDHAEVEQLMKSYDEATKTLAALAYLIWYDWIGVCKDGRRVWLGSDGQSRLRRAG